METVSIDIFSKKFNSKGKEIISDTYVVLIFDACSKYYMYMN